MTTVGRRLLRQIAGEADLGEVKKWLENLSPDQEDCRFELGHAWERHDAFRQANGFVRIAKCGRCWGLRKRFYVHGRIVSSNYTPSEGYPAPAGIGHLSADDIAALREILFEKEMSEKAEQKAKPAKGNSRRKKVAA